MSKNSRGGNKAKRTTISLNPIVNAWAEQLVRDEGHNSLSDLISDLIRRKKEASENPDPDSYPPHKGQYLEAAETIEPPPLPPGPPLPKEKKPRKAPPGGNN